MILRFGGNEVFHLCIIVTEMRPCIGHLVARGIVAGVEIACHCMPAADVFSGIVLRCKPAAEGFRHIGVIVCKTDELFQRGSGICCAAFLVNDLFDIFLAGRFIHDPVDLVICERVCRLGTDQRGGNFHQIDFRFVGEECSHRVAAPPAAIIIRIHHRAAYSDALDSHVIAFLVTAR